MCPPPILMWILLKRLIEILTELKEGKTIIVSIHDLIFSDYGGVTFHLLNGHLANVCKKE